MDSEKHDRLNLDFPRGSRARARFEHLCDIGCDPTLLFAFLTLAIFSAQSKRTLYDIFGVSRSALLKLPERLEKISVELEAVDPLLERYIQAKFVENPNCPDRLRRGWVQQAAVYRTTPKLLRLLAGHLRVAEEWLQEYFGPRKIDTFRSSVIQLLQYVDTCTGSPHYEEVSELLERLFLKKEQAFRRIATTLPQAPRRGAPKKKRDTPPKLLCSSVALKALYLRSAKYGFRKTRPHSSKPPSA